jgi:hypothetical protein
MKEFRLSFPLDKKRTCFFKFGLFCGFILIENQESENIRPKLGLIEMEDFFKHYIIPDFQKKYISL